MATRTAVQQDTGQSGAFVVTWTGLLNGDDGSAAELLDVEDKFGQFTGTFGAGGSIQMEASNDGTNWFIFGTALTAAGTQNYTPRPRYVRPRVTAGDGTTNLTVILAVHRHF